jgi:glycine cleavage system aminomethyltransferase T
VIDLLPSINPISTEKAAMTHRTLEEKLQFHASPIEMLYNSPAEPFQFPLKSAYSTWIDEQLAWKNAAIFQDMSFHMTDVSIKGPDTYTLLSRLAINSFEGFGAMQAKQFVACNPDGYVIGDGILLCEKENEVSLLGRPGTLSRLKFHAETGGYDVKVVRVDGPTGEKAALPLSDTRSERGPDSGEGKRWPAARYRILQDG